MKTYTVRELAEIAQWCKGHQELASASLRHHATTPTNTGWPECYTTAVLALPQAVERLLAVEAALAARPSSPDVAREAP